MRELNSVKAEEMMRTREILLFKDRLMEYLRSFVKSLQIHMTAIEQRLGNVNKGAVRRILERVTAYEVSIPGIDVEVKEQMIYEKISGRCGKSGRMVCGKGGTGVRSR